MNISNSFFGEDDLVSNPTTRVPVCLCLDTSYSMSAVTGGDYQFTGKTCMRDGRMWNLVDGDVTTRIGEMQKGIQSLYDYLRNDEVAYYSAEICIVTFNDTAECIKPFSNIELLNNMNNLSAQGMTAMGEGVNLALDLLEKRKKQYSEMGIDYFQPWLIIMTDGEPTGDTKELNRAIKRTNELVNKKKLTIFPIGIGDEADMSVLSRLSPRRTPLRLKGLRFCEFFEWLGKSISTTSQSMPGEAIHLDMEGLKGWSELL